MSLSRRIFSFAWIVAVLAAAALIVLADRRAAARVGYVSSLARPATAEAEARPDIIIPERNETVFRWLARADEMLEQRRWRIRNVASENAPLGHETHVTSPFAWCLAAAAWIDHAVTGRPLARAVGDAALFFPLLLHLALLIGASVVARRFGPGAAALVAIAVATLFPLAAGFLPGVPEPHALALAAALGGLLLLLAGLRERANARRWFMVAGVLGGFGLWVDLPTQAVVLLGTLAGGAAVGVLRRFRRGDAEEKEEAAPWLSWAGAGAATILVGYLVEYGPDQLGGWRLQWIHPLYGVAWLGAGRLLEAIEGGRESAEAAGNFRRGLGLGLAMLAVAALPIAIALLGGDGWFASDGSAYRLSSQAGQIAAPSFWSWLVREGMSATARATLLPLVIIVPALWLLVARTTAPRTRETILFTFGPVAAGLWLGAHYLRGWQMLDAGLIGMMVAASAAPMAGRTAVRVVGWSLVVAVFAVPGWLRVLPAKFSAANVVLTASEAQELVERDLAAWLAQHSPAPGATVFAPPQETATLVYYGGLRGIGTFDPENRAGFAAALTITGAQSMEEVQAALQVRGVRFVVIPSWDPFFDEFARRYIVASQANRTSLLVTAVRDWRLPPWLRPLAYQMPEIPGFERQFVLVFAVVDEQSPAAAASRLAEYFVETGRVRQAVALEPELGRFPADVGAIAAQAQIRSAVSDAKGFTEAIGVLRTRIGTGADRYLAWDRRVTLAAVLAEGNELELAKAQLRRCVADVTADRLRELTPGSLYRLLVLCHAFGDEIGDRKLRGLAMELLPPALRAQL